MNAGCVLHRQERPGMTRKHITFYGFVQGVGFRFIRMEKLL